MILNTYFVHVKQTLDRVKSHRRKHCGIDRILGYGKVNKAVSPDKKQMLGSRASEKFSSPFRAFKL